MLRFDGQETAGVSATSHLVEIIPDRHVINLLLLLLSEHLFGRSRADPDQESDGPPRQQPPAHSLQPRAHQHAALGDEAIRCRVAGGAGRREQEELHSDCLRYQGELKECLGGHS
jgi:hypothetical protein